MSYTPSRDFTALLRQTDNGARLESMPGLDYVVAALARAGMFLLSIGQTAPTVDQAITAWFKPAVPSWAAEGALFLWNPLTSEYEFATPELWSILLASGVVPVQVTQDVAVAGPTAIVNNAGIVRVMNVGAPVALVLPLASGKIGNVLISDWLNAAGTNNITITLSGSDKFPNGLTTLVIAGDGGSVFLRPVTGGYAT